MLHSRRGLRYVYRNERAGAAWLLAYMKKKYGAVILTAEVLTINTASVKILGRAPFHVDSESEEQRDSDFFDVRDFRPRGVQQKVNILCEDRL